MNKTKIAVDVFNKMANVYQEKFMDVNLYSNSLDLFCEKIQGINPYILDIGCGPGNITKYISDRRKDLNILGIDLAPNMIRLAQINNPNAVFQILDFREIAKIGKYFDGIICGFCLPYLSKEEAINLIGNAAKILNPKGLLYLSTMEDDYSKSGFKKGSSGDEIFMHYHQFDYLSDTLNENGFKILNSERINYENADGTFTTDLIIIAEI